MPLIPRIHDELVSSFKTRFVSTLADRRIGFRVLFSMAVVDALFQFIPPIDVLAQIHVHIFYSLFSFSIASVPGR